MEAKEVIVARVVTSLPSQLPIRRSGKSTMVLGQYSTMRVPVRLQRYSTAQCGVAVRLGCSTAQCGVAVRLGAVQHSAGGVRTRDGQIYRHAGSALVCKGG
jgi:hypothetical protein